MNQTLIVNEIYPAIQGEGTAAGRACTIVRLTGCNLRCRWCDTTYAYDEGREMTVAEVQAEVGRLARPLVLVTGGEPLCQAGTGGLLAALCDAGWEVMLETNGSMDLAGVDGRVVRCMDVKCPGSGEGGSVRWANLDGLRPCDEVKFVLAGRADYDFARRVVAERRLGSRCTVIFTPAAGVLAPAELAEWMLADAPDARLGLQLHKILWPEARRGR